MHNISI